MIPLRIALVSLALVACQDEPPPTAATPPTPQQGVTAFVSVDNPSAQPGQVVRVRVEVQVGSESTFKVGSFTGRLRFDPAALRFTAENPINDGMRVANANGAASGEIRFAGASPSGLTTLVLYDGTFEVRAAGFAQGLRLQMEELSAALSLADLAPRLQVNRQVFQYRAAAPRP
jgi:hypothetical protein